jgi:hypothetical protein
LSNNSGEGFLGCLTSLAFIGVFAFVWWAGGWNQAWYTLQYGVNPSRIQVDAKPSDCDFMTAPLGSKGCHYAASVTTYNADDAPVGGDRAPKYRTDNANGRLYASYDGGETWGVYTGGPLPDPTVARVVVSWVRMSD